MEPFAIEKLEIIIGEKIEKCGLFIDPIKQYLAATPGNIIIKLVFNF